jgi:mannose/fructose/N-acetylgalactosamine-specific phosphotransferase system component IID
VLVKCFIKNYKTSDAWIVLEIKVIFSPPPIYGGVKDKLVNKNSNGSILLLVVRVLTSSISFPTSSMLSSTSTIEILISRGSISKLVPFLSGLIGFVITTCCCFYLETKMWEVTHVVLILISISILKKLGGTYLNFGKAVW